MSGIAGVVRLDGAPVTPTEVEPLMRALRFRGPDGTGMRVDGAAGLGRAWLRLGDEAPDKQPLTLDGRAWIVADARIDARDDLVAALRGRGEDAGSSPGDAQLILHAFRAWGETCVEHLLGDFAFAIWEPAARRLFCARDHFGVRAFFYALQGAQVVFGNTLEAVRAHPGVPSGLDEQWIADFLMFGESLEPDATVSGAIRRLPPACTLSVTPEGARVRRYWALDEQLPVRYRSQGDYAEHYAELLRRAVADRMRSRRIGIEMSGGLDSTSVAVTAKALLDGSSQPGALSAHTGVFDSLVPDDEGRYAQMVARHAGFPLRVFPSDNYRLFERFDHPEIWRPEPFHDPLYAHRRDMCGKAVTDALLIFTGWEGDAWLNESPKPYLRWLAGNGRWAEAARAALGYAWLERRVVPHGLRDRVMGRRGIPPAAQRLRFPPWLATDFMSRLDLRERWERWRNAAAPRPHPVRPRAFGDAAYIAQCSNHFEWYDAGMTGLPAQYAHPMMDVRLIEYCVSVPPTPWCVRKFILKRAMRGALPESVLRRPKTPIGHGPMAALLHRDAAVVWDAFAPIPELSRFVDVSSLRLNWPEGSVETRWRDLQAISLDHWLRKFLAR